MHWRTLIKSSGSQKDQLNDCQVPKVQKDIWEYIRPRGQKHAPGAVRHGLSHVPSGRCVNTDCLNRKQIKPNSLSSSQLSFSINFALERSRQWTERLISICGHHIDHCPVTILSQLQKCELSRWSALVTVLTGRWLQCTTRSCDRKITHYFSISTLFLLFVLSVWHLPRDVWCIKRLIPTTMQPWWV